MGTKLARIVTVAERLLTAVCAEEGLIIEAFPTPVIISHPAKEYPVSGVALIGIESKQFFRIAVDGSTVPKVALLLPSCSVKVSGTKSAVIVPEALTVTDVVESVLSLMINESDVVVHPANLQFAAGVAEMSKLSP